MRYTEGRNEAAELLGELSKRIATDSRKEVHTDLALWWTQTNSRKALAKFSQI